MAYISENELKFLRILERTKRLTKENLSANVWKVSAATKILNNLIYILQDDEKIKDIIHEYRQEVVQLQLLAEAESKNSTEESLKIIEKIPRTFPDRPADSSTVSTDDFPEKESAAGLRAIQRGIYRSDLRKQLLSSTKHKLADTSADDTFMKNERVEEDLANDLLSVTRLFKNQMSAAGDVIREDNKKLTKMTKQVEDNKSALETESTRLEHHAYKCGFDCMRIFLFIFLLWSFIAMVAVMKVFPKRAVY